MEHIVGRLFRRRNREMAFQANWPWLQSSCWARFVRSIAGCWESKPITAGLSAVTECWFVCWYGSICSWKHGLSMWGKHFSDPLLVKEVDIPKWGVMYRGLVNHNVYFTFSTKCLKDNEGCIKCQRVVVCDGSVMFSALTPTQVQGRFRSMSGIFVTPWSRF